LHPFDTVERSTSGQLELQPRELQVGALCREARCEAVLGWLDAGSRSGACAGCGRYAECGGGCPEILLSMCGDRSENEYCYFRLEQQRILAEVLDDA